MQIDILKYYQKGIEETFENRYDLAVLIDVYRATSSMVIAAHRGANDIFAVNTLEEMYQAKNTSIILCGERNAIKPEGFDFGNSPLELLKANLKDKKVFISTSNGTRTLSAFRKNSDNFIATSFLNLSPTVEYINKKNYNKILLLCAGSWEKFSLEDYLCACIILSQLEKELSNIDDDKTLQITTGKYFHSSKPELQKALQNTDHAKRLKNIGKYDDVEFITSSIDHYEEIPVIKMID
jgi:2-phosphosulfolactate phosphatase